MIAIVLSPFRSPASFDKYRRGLEEAEEQAAGDFQVVATKNFYDHPCFIETQAGRISEILKGISSGEAEKTMLLFSAHSIPLGMSRECAYAEEFVSAATLVAKKLKMKNWGLAWQSRSGRVSERWLGPDVKTMIEKLDRNRFRSVVLAPIGFVCENVELAYDLDIEIRDFCGRLGLGYLRAPAAGAHPKFIELMGELVRREIGRDF